MVFVAYVVIVNGNDYAAIKAFEEEGYEPEFFVYVEINEINYDFGNKFDYQVERFEFESETAFESGKEMLYHVINFCQDYDDSKHTDFRIVSEQDLKEYKPPNTVKKLKKRKNSNDS